MTERQHLRIQLSLLAGVFCFGGCAVEQPAAPVVAQSATAAAPEPAVKKEPVRKAPVQKPVAAPKAGAITEVDLGRLMELRDAGKVLLVDVRPSMFFTMGHIPGAVSLPKKTYPASWGARKGQIDEAVAAGKVVVLYCTNTECPDGYAVAKKMAPLGYDVSIYKGGWEEWKMAGFE